MRSVVFLLLLLFFQGPQTQNSASIAGVIVQAGTSTPVAGARVSLGPAMTTTDDGGRFEFQNVQPGRYKVIASHEAYAFQEYGQRAPGFTIIVGAGQAVKDLVIGLVPKSGISGRVYDSNEAPVAGARVQALTYTYQDGRRILIAVAGASTNAVGEYRLLSLVPGPYIVKASTKESPCLDGSCSSGDSLLPVYYPGTADPAGAAPINVPPGLDLTGVDFRITESRSLLVAGQVINGLTGKPIPTAGVTLLPRRGTVATGTLRRARVENDGTFEFRQMAPGSYEVVASSPDPQAGRLAGSASIEMRNEDVNSVTLVLQPQLTISGRITIENAPGLVSPNFNTIRVELRREPFVPELLVTLPNVKPDGTFTLGGVTPGEYRLKVEGRGSTAYVKSARFGSIDALNPPFPISGPGEFDVVISLNSGSVDAVVYDDAQKPFYDATVVLVPEAPRRQRLDLYYATGSDPAGRAHFAGVAPGDYRIFAWDDAPSDAWQDPDFLRPYEGGARPVRVVEGTNGRIEVRVIPRI